MTLLIIMNLFGTGISSRIDDMSSLIKIGVIVAVFIATVVWFVLGHVDHFAVAQAKPSRWRTFQGPLGTPFTCLPVFL